MGDCSQCILAALARLRVGYAKNGKENRISEPEKAYLAGLLHDIGFLVNSVLYTEDFRECLRRAAEQHAPLHVIEEQVLGFTHCDSGQMLSEHWGLPKDLVDAAGCHHNTSLLAAAGPVACLVHLSDLLCRVSYLGYGYDEIRVLISAVMQRGKSWLPVILRLQVWTSFVLRLTSMEPWTKIVAAVDSVFGVKRNCRSCADVRGQHSRRRLLFAELCRQ